MSGVDAAGPAPYVTEPGPPGTRFPEIRRFVEIDSTNRYLRELSATDPGVPEGLVAVAEHQTAGRGRLGRRWEAPPAANLLVSILLVPDLPAEELHLVSAAVALGAADACAAVSGLEPGLKWPNDLVVGGEKLAGILAESTPVAGRDRRAVVVGLGCNVRWPGTDDADVPPELLHAVTSLYRETGRPVEPTVLLRALLVAADPWLALLVGDRTDRLRLAGEYRRRCTTVGQEVRVEVPSGVLRGRAQDVTDAGHLVVATGDGVVTVTAGDVVHVRPAS